MLHQIPHLAEGVRIHGEKVTEALRPFHDRLEACFRQLREKVEKQYGAKTLVNWFNLAVTFLFATVGEGSVEIIFLLHELPTLNLRTFETF